MLKCMEVESLRKIFNDRMKIEVGSEHVTFRVRIDGSNDEFRVNKLEFKEFLLGVKEMENK